MKDVNKKDFRKNEDAFVAVITEYREDLFRTAIAFLKNKEKALEAIQEVTFRAYKKRRQLKDLKYVKTWLIRIMINYCNDVLKKDKNISAERSIDKPVMDNHHRIWLDDALKTLRQDEQELIYFKYFYEMTFHELAEQLNIPESTVKTRIYAALKKLRKELDIDEEGGVLK
ncbi:sigma-70 family RNA polymerase sigma factor [Gracilibacillus oryzae]|uniref:Sigma-70 family RNA polymerase sigma factor n=1 Tax=Gracilibacillus oryzae TaxID=1672701 RepID=A0A7C8GS37_9BACI|nr:sigma-70 family RNA polymerase sigma factor [Gracilibacillus oryzae]KAB8129372.1 sigma-70 family RNA polymerase sigma factor [Gracilibacillus oryzae]